MAKRICQCGCKKPIINNRVYLKGHNSRADKISKTTKGVSWNEKYGKERANKIRKSNSKKFKGRLICKSTRIKLSNYNKKYSNQYILNELLKMFNIYPKLKKSDLYGAGKFKGVICHESCVRYRFGSFDKAAEYIGKKFNKERRWEKKEELIGDVLKFFHPNIKYHSYYKNIGFPDFDTENIIYDAKSTLNDIKVRQVKKYESTGKNVFIIPFENKGETNLEKKKIIFLDSLINRLPNNLQSNFLQRKEAILNGQT